MSPSEFAPIMLKIVENIDEYEEPDIYQEALMELMGNSIKTFTKKP
jgi:hypothetical protein